MPPFANAKCPHCGHRNRFDVAELRKSDGYAYKGIVFRGAEDNEDFAVTCENCGRSFKLTVKGGENAKEK
jgi:transcription elongation factor Elf1